MRIIDENKYKRIKVLFIIEQSSISYKYFENIFIELNKSAHFEIEVFNLVKDDIVNQHLKQFCSKVFTLPNDKAYKKQLFTIRKIIQLCKPDIIHAHEVIPCFYATIALLTNFSNTKLIFHRHHSFYRTKVMKFMERIAFSRCNLAISVSKTAQKVAFLEHPLNKKKILQLYNGVTVKDNNFPLPVDMNLYRNEYKIVLLARLRNHKGHDTAIAAIELVRKKIPNVILFFAGEGDLRKKIEKIVDEKKIQQNIVLLGDVLNIKELLNEADISILPSESEAFNLSILETFACKRLSIASDLPSIKECILDGETGILVKSGDAQQLAEKIIFYLENKEERNEIAENAYKLYNQEFTTTVMVNKMITIYTKLIAGHKNF